MNKNKITLYILGSVFVLLSVLNIFTEAPSIILSERRVPARRPSLSSFFDGDFSRNFERASADAFIFRETARGLKAFWTFYIYFKLDKDGVYTDSHGIASFERLNENSIKREAERISALVREFENLNLYFAVIPDKSEYADITRPGFIAESAANILEKELLGVKRINLKLEGAFYKTDLHWNQEKIFGAAQTIAEAMGTKLNFAHFERAFAGYFRGVYPGQLALPWADEPLYYFKNNNLKAYYFDMSVMDFLPGPIYDLEMFKGLDPYDIFLRGPNPLIALENSSALEEKILYIFRDSFSSSLAPLLATGYSAVYLIDLRFLDITTLRSILDFSSGDVLFLYSSVILN